MAKVDELKKEIAEEKYKKKQSDLLSKIIEKLEVLAFRIDAIEKPPKEIIVKNLPDIVKTVTVDNLQEINIPSIPPFPEIKIPDYPTEIKVTKPIWFSFEPVLNELDGLRKDVLSIKAPKAETLEKYTKKNNALAVKLVTADGKDFYNAFGSSGGGFGLDMTPTNTVLQEIKTILDTLDVTINASDIEIGAVEIKNGNDDTRAAVDSRGLNTYDTVANNLITGNWDTATQTQNATSDVWAFTLAGNPVATITINYSSAAKTVITTIVKTL